MAYTVSSNKLITISKVSLFNYYLKYGHAPEAGHRTYKCKVKIIPYVMTWEELVTKYHKKHREKIGIQPRTEAYIQSLVLYKTFESISFDRRRGLEECCKVQEEVEDLASKIVESASEVVKADTLAN